MFKRSDFAFEGGNSLVVQGNPESGAVFSAQGVHRYVLWRSWAPIDRILVWCMLNPSTANAEADDATIRKCRGFSQRAAFSAMVIVNLFGLRSRAPTALLDQPWNAVGQHNDACIGAVLARTKAVTMLCGWGATGPAALQPRILARAQEVRSYTWSCYRTHLQCLGVAQNGMPRHPLMLSYATQMEPWIIPPGFRATADLG